MCGPNYRGEIGLAGPKGLVGKPGEDYIPNLKGAHPLSGPPGEGYVWKEDKVNYTFGVWVKENSDAV